MNTLYESLYQYAGKREDLTRWLHDQDIVRDYQSSVTYSQRQEKELRDGLTEGWLELFERYVENMDLRQDLEGLMLFCQGLSMGIQLGVQACL